MKELIDQIARSLVDHPEKVDIFEHTGGQTAVFDLRVAQDDIGKVIGKNGRTATAIRTILNAASAKNRKRVILEILD